ncbi:unnamed protein product [Citrullus colocynthis]|uniref:Cytochrome P450 n=1 Tax=Citrullus colocynthis TaxID=252529 RepID=A0ABP0ZEJ5_9ROSI
MISQRKIFETFPLDKEHRRPFYYSNWTSKLFPHLELWRNRHGQNFVYSSGTIQIVCVKEMSLSTSLWGSLIPCGRIVGRYWASAFRLQVAQFGFIRGRSLLLNYSLIKSREQLCEIQCDQGIISGCDEVMLYYAHPNLQARVGSEVLQCCQHRPINADTIKNMKMLTIMIQEALKLYPPAVFATRQALENIKIQNIMISKGMNVQIPMSEIGQWIPQSLQESTGLITCRSGSAPECGRAKTLQ